jgi:hypothetical protein
VGHIPTNRRAYLWFDEYKGPPMPVTTGDRTPGQILIADPTRNLIELFQPAHPPAA